MNAIFLDQCSTREGTAGRSVLKTIWFLKQYGKPGRFDYVPAK